MSAVRLEVFAMRVTKITVSDDANEKASTSIEIIQEGNPAEIRTDQARVLTSFTKGSRLSLVGRINGGRGGVILSPDGDISGHKLDPLQDQTEYEHFSHADSQLAIQRLLNGHAVLINSPTGLLTLRWNPLTLEVFASGRDSAST